MWAAKNGNENMVKILLHHGAHVNIKDKVKKSAYRVDQGFSNVGILQGMYMYVRNYK